jgi:hypothetical protein
MFTIIAVTGFSIAQHLFQLDSLSLATSSPKPHASTLQLDSVVDTQEEAQSTDSKA